MIRPPLALLALALAGCAFPVQGEMLGRSLPPVGARAKTILVIYNHGFSTDSAGTYQPRLPPILERARDANPDVVVFAQVRNTSRLDAGHHADYIEAAIEHFQRVERIPLSNIILAGQSCGGWGSLQAAAFTYPGVGGVLAFAPTCHGRLPHSTTTRDRRAQQIESVLRRARFPGIIFVYEGDSYYPLTDWERFETWRAPDSPLAIERLGPDAVRRVCSRCARDSHGAVWDPAFAVRYLDSHVQPLIERVRASAAGR